MTNNEEVLTRLVDEVDIRKTIARFGMAATVEDISELRSLWTEDGVWTIGAPANHTAQGIDEIADLYTGLRTGNDYFMQFTTPGAIDIDGDTATVRSMCQEFASGPNERYYRNSGIWTDRLRRTADGWKFTSRNWNILWIDLSPYSGQTLPIEG